MASNSKPSQANSAFHEHCGKMLSHKNSHDLHSSVKDANLAGPVQAPLLSSFLQENASQKGSVVRSCCQVRENRDERVFGLDPLQSSGAS